MRDIGERGGSAMYDESIALPFDGN
jgi:hypothetical protein